jgi:hypothetical protein
MAKWQPNRVNIRKTAQLKGRELVIPTAERVRDVAKRIAPSKTGRLRKSIRMQRKITARYVRADVGSLLPYAAAQHEGAKRHEIKARRAKLLRFYWVREGVTFVGPIVRNHPGNKGHEYLWRPLRQIATRRGFIVVRVKLATPGASAISTGTIL